jgi:hypothetical protein
MMRDHPDSTHSVQVIVRVFVLGAVTAVICQEGSSKELPETSLVEGSKLGQME